MNKQFFDAQDFKSYLDRLANLHAGAVMQKPLRLKFGKNFDSKANRLDIVLKKSYHILAEAIENKNAQEIDDLLHPKKIKSFGTEFCYCTMHLLNPMDMLLRIPPEHKAYALMDIAKYLNMVSKINAQTQIDVLAGTKNLSEQKAEIELVKQIDDYLKWVNTRYFGMSENKFQRFKNLMLPNAPFPQELQKFSDPAHKIILRLQSSAFQIEAKPVQKLQSLKTN